MDGKHLLRFQSETSDFKFLRCSVDEKQLMCFRVKLPFSNSSGVVWTENILMGFQSETSVFKFLWRGVARPKLWCVHKVYF